MAKPAEKLPVEVAEELKWYVWNDIWARVNSRLAGQEEGKRRAERQRLAREDSERADTHFRKAVTVNAFSKATLQKFRRQVASIGSMAASGESVMAAEAMTSPDELDGGLWEDLVEAIKNAAVAANLLSKGGQEKKQAAPLQAKFEASWRAFEEDVGSYYAEEEDEASNAAGFVQEEAAAVARAALPPGLAADLKWFAWNHIWARVNSELAAQRGGEEGARRHVQAREDGKRAEAHFKALQSGGLSKEVLQQYRCQVEELGVLSSQGLKEGNWLLAASAQALPAPEDMDAQLWSDVVRAVKCAAVAANVMSRQDNVNMAFQAEFDEAWSQLEVN